MMYFLIFAIALLLIMAAVFFTIGPERSLETAFGNSDLGAADLKTIKRRPSGNDALACPPDFCDVKINIITPAFNLPASQLRNHLREKLQSEERLTEAHTDDAALQDRYVQRSPTMKYPDTIQVEYIQLSNTQSTIALYSRSQIGSSDFGVNLKRIERWLSYLEQHQANE